MCAGVVPQQPPAMWTRPAAAYAATARANGSGATAVPASLEQPRARSARDQPRPGRERGERCREPAGPLPAVQADAVYRRRIDRVEPLGEADSRRGHAPAARQRGRDEDRHAAAGRVAGIGERAQRPLGLRRRPPGLEEQDIDAALQQTDQRRAKCRAKALGRHAADPRPGSGSGSAGPRAPATRRGRCGVRCDHSSAAARARRAAARHRSRAPSACARRRGAKGVGADDVRPRLEIRVVHRPNDAGCDQVSASVGATGPVSPAVAWTNVAIAPSSTSGLRAVRARSASMVMARAISGRRARSARAGAAARAAYAVQRRRPREALQEARCCRATSKTCTPCTSRVSRCTSLAISRWMKATILQTARTVVHNSSSARAARPGWISAATRKERIGLADGICSTFRSRQEHP